MLFYSHLFELTRAVTDTGPYFCLVSPAITATIQGLLGNVPIPLFGTSSTSDRASCPSTPVIPRTVHCCGNGKGLDNMFPDQKKLIPYLNLP